MVELVEGSVARRGWRLGVEEDVDEALVAGGELGSVGAERVDGGVDLAELAAVVGPVGVVPGGEEEPEGGSDAVEVDDVAHGQVLLAAQRASAVGVGLMAGVPRPSGWISQWRWGGVVAALPVWPT